MGAGGSALVLLPLLISGYLFNLVFYPLRYFGGRAEGQKLFFMAAGSGLILAGTVFGICGVVQQHQDFVGSPVQLVAAAIDSAIPIPYACRFALTIISSVLFAFALNLILKIFYGRDKSSTAKAVYNKLTDRFGSALTQILRRAADKQKLVLLTLKSRKIYCGRILEVPANIENEDACIELLPSFSTYRDKDTLRMGEEKTEYPVIALWEAQQYLYSRKATKELLEIALRSLSEALHAEDIEELRNTIDQEIHEAENVINQFSQIGPIEPNDWVKVIPLKEIETASFYDPNAYKAWFSVSVQQAAEPTGIATPTA